MENEEYNNSNQETDSNTQEQSIETSVLEAEVSETNEVSTVVKKGLDIPVKLLLGVALSIIVIVAGVFFYNSQDKHVAIQQFTNVYSFVPEKISKSAPVQINLPDGVDEETARNSISFSPEVEGSWSTEEIEGVVVFEPKKPLKSGVYYAVNMDTGAVQMSGDFYVDEDPQVEAIFPGVGSESHEDSEITIVFNRPMVPLTTLTEQEKTELPITITPETPGKFKWISTRNLQFVPETTLIPSSDYTVEIKDGLYSLDGLAIAPVTHDFVTRPLRYEYVSSEQIGYRSPIIIDFNQPVDLDETSKQIKVEEENEGNVSIEVEYGDVTYYDRESREYVTESDPSKLFIYQKKDSHGRSNLWDFDTTYNVSIGGASPLAGTKDLSEGKNTVVSVPNIVENTTAQSDRSTLVRPDLFDPQGTLTVSFYDDVDKDRSDINIKGLKNIEYGERCRTDEKGNSVRLGSGCDMEDDKRTLIFSFNADTFTTDESLNLELKKIKTPDGFQVNADPINISLKTFPSFQILHTVPENGSQSASVGSGIYMCTNVPLKSPEEGYVDEFLSTEGYIVYGKMQKTRFIERKSSWDQCNSGEFETWFQYGLLPETDYSFSLSLIDSFGQSASRGVSIRTEAVESKYTRFHNMQKQYNVTPSDRTNLTYAVENLEYVDMHICRMEPETFLERTVNRADRFDSPRSDGCTQVISEKILLPARYWVNNYFQVNLADHFTDTRGHYVLTFSNPLYKETYRNRQLYDRTYVSVTNLAVGKKEVEYSDDAYGVSENPANDQVLDETINASSNLYWVNNSKTLAAINGASVVQYEGGNNKSFVRKTSGFTSPEGIARVSIHNDLVGAVVRSGLDSAVITDWADTLKSAGKTRDASRTYVYTDRPIYRPGHTVHIRGIDRIGFDGTYEVWNEGQVKLEVFDSGGTRVYETNLEQNDYGTFNTDFEIPSDAPLGTYRIEVFGQSSRFDVEEYVPAAFKLEAESNKDEFINGDHMKVEVQADYYFGVPLSEGTVSYSVTAQDYYFDRYTDEYFNFGRSWYYCYSCGYGDDFLFRGETTLDGSGRAVIEKEMKFEDFFDDVESEGSKLVTVSITAKDINGRSVSMQKSFIVHKGDFYIGAKTDRYYTSVNSPLTLRVKTVDPQGQPISLKSIERTLYKVNWETFKRQEVDGGFYYRSEKKLEEISSERIKTDDRGDYDGELTFTEEGQYEVHISKDDDGGNKIKTISNIYIYGSRSISVPPNNNYELDIEVEKTDLEVGDMASLLIKSPYDTAKVLISAERGTVYDYWIADIKGGLYLHEFPITSEYAPNVFVSALLLSSDPEIKYGSVRYEIGNDENELSVDVTSNKNHYLPGEEVTLSVETRDHTGRLIPAEVSLAVADLSVLALKGNPKKNPALFFYDGFPLSVTTASNIKNILYEVDIPLGTKGGGGADPDDLSKKKRGVFKDTAFWEASVVTDQNGKATVSFTLPDNLTTWQIEGLGVTKDTKLGVDYEEFTTKKDLMAVPLKPRFVVPGDQFSLGAKVFNQTERGTTVNIKLESDTLAFTDGQEDSVFINKGETKTVYFDVEAPNSMKAGNHNFTFTASDETFIDSVEQVIPITPNTTFETVATANFTKDDRAVEYLYVPDEVVSGEGGLTINANATMAVFMTDALSYMVTYPYGCSEQLASSLSTIGTLTSALTIPNVEGEFETIEHDGVTYTVDTVVTNGLSQVYESQTLGGGFAYYKGLKPNLPLTMHVVTGLSNLKEAGYEVREDVLRRGSAYIESETKRVYSEYPANNQETVVLAEYVLRTVNGGDKTSLTSIVETLIDDKAFLNEKISSMSLAYLSILTADGFSRSSKNQVYDALKNRIDIDGRGAYLTTIVTANRAYFETPVKNTALLLKAFAAHGDEHPAMANVLRWLLASRDNSGVWGGTHNTFTVVDGMIDYLKWQHETESHFTLRGLLDGVEIFGFEFNPSNVFETFTHYIPIDEFAREKLLPLVFERENHNDMQNNLYYDMALKYFLPAASLPPRDEGITIERGLYELNDTREENSLSSVSVGDVIKGKLTITIPDHYSHVAIEDMIPAGFEIVNFNLDTEDQSLLDNSGVGVLPKSDSGGLLSRITNVFGESQTAQVYRSQGFGGSYGNDTRKLRPTHVESHDDRVFLYVEELREGVYEYEYFLRALVPGEFQHLPARAEELFFPEVFGRTGGGLIEVTPAS
jgi:uncharacterized protein YfaS (alpha-2-macroglobulin family)